jgi:hypothetical protein
MEMSKHLIIDTPRFRVEAEREGAKVTLRPTGAIDEDVNLGTVLEWLAGLGSRVDTVDFDLGHVQAINSCGIREWLLFMERLNRKARCMFHNVCEIFLEQGNMISNIFGPITNEVRSFQAPYHCPKCDQQTAILLEPRQVNFVQDVGQPPEATCPKCGSSLKFDSLEEEYFSFIRRQRESGRAA